MHARVGSSLPSAESCSGRNSGRAASPSTSVAYSPATAADITAAAKTLSAESANVVCEIDRRESRAVFRRGGVELAVPRSVSEGIVEALRAQGGAASMLVELRGHDVATIESALRAGLTKGVPPTDAWRAHGIAASVSFQRVLLVAPYGDRDGRPLKYVLPHIGVDIIAATAIRDIPGVDVRVYNPNLGSREDLYRLVHHEQFDVIGFSILMLTLEASLKMVGKVHSISPKSIIAFGGADLKHFPFEDLFRAVPVDVCITDRGQGFLRLLGRIQKGSAAEERGPALNSVLRSIPNFIFSEHGVIVRTPTSESEALAYQHPEDIPFDAPDLTHGKAYQVRDTSESFVPLDRIGVAPMPVQFGNYCSARCIFCCNYSALFASLRP